MNWIQLFLALAMTWASTPQTDQGSVPGTWAVATESTRGAIVVTASGTATSRFACMFNKPELSAVLMQRELRDALLSGARQLHAQATCDGVGDNCELVVPVAIVTPANEQMTNVYVFYASVEPDGRFGVRATLQNTLMKTPTCASPRGCSQPTPHEFSPAANVTMRNILSAAEGFYRKGSAAEKVDCSVPRAPRPARVTRLASAAGSARGSKDSWAMFDVDKEAMERDDDGNDRLVNIVYSVATVTLRTRLDTVGTTQRRVVTYQDLELADDLLAAARAEDAGAKAEGFALAAIDATVKGEPYNLSMMRRAKPGAKEEDFHAILSYEEDDSRVSVFVTGPSAEVRHRLLAATESLYGKRPAVLNCVGASDLGRDDPRRKLCYPSR